ncbi:MAG: acyl-CoA dehydrogenase family protein [Myxococcota bacterium]|nr:acyl-CoA dehydrogenase family protein [Myxococcota bacterium]
MAAYLNDGMLLYLDHLVDWDTYFRWTKGDDADVDTEVETLRVIAQTAAEICESIAPEAREGWEEAARLEDGEVAVPGHIARGYERLREAGIVSFGVAEQYGGVALPGMVGNWVLQMISRADAGLMTIVGLQAGVALDIQEFGTEELKQEWLPRFASGEVQGAMDLTEPQAGSDLGAISTLATETGEEGRVTLDGQKIFITNGGSEVHLVLARDADTAEQSKGTTKGLSLYLCPRTRPDGSSNGVAVERLEHKQGIHGSPTAAIRFDGAQATRLGPKGEGFKAMLQLMNNARIGVAAQGIGIGEAALDEALQYTRQRVQFGQPIAEQPLVKNMLSSMILDLEGSRALLYRCCALIDRNTAIDARLDRDEVSEAERAELESIRERNETRIRLLTPLAKYAATEACDRITRSAVQLHGGVGFMAESVVGRLHADGIITTIYEGTSEIQVSFALKEIGKGAMHVVFDEIRKELEGLDDSELDEYASKVRAGIEQVLQASSALMADFSYALLSARRLADSAIDLIVGAELLKHARVDSRRFDLAASWINRKMLEVEMNARRIAEGDVSRVDRCERIISTFESA